jgi:SAM-dependent methyltransferase
MSCNPTCNAILRCARCVSGATCVQCGICTACGTQVPVRDGIVCALARTDPFYESAYVNQVHLPGSALNSLLGRLKLAFVNYGYVRQIVKYVAPHSRVLELGCGGGIQIAADIYNVTALDLSYGSLRQTPAGYRNKINADVLEIDFCPSSFDAVVASCFFEHLTVEQKVKLINSIHRWLRPGGTIVLLFDTESNNPFFRWLRRYPRLYQTQFVDHDGHVGLQSPSTNRAYFTAAGFRHSAGIGLNRTVQHLPVYTWMRPYGRHSLLIRVLSRIASVVESITVTHRLFTASVHLFDLTVGRLFPESWSRLYVGVWERLPD